MDQDESDHEVTKSDPLTEAADDNALLDTVVDTEEALKNMSKAHRARLFMSGGKFKKWRSAESKLTRSKKIKAGRSSKK
ncbi:hypothetical protein BASA81_005200 [Batrachochytrium salamandrivorans]|nr:hypothetical protein BASA81_005200 [Batrachochytrium salamandrivorans]